MLGLTSIENARAMPINGKFEFLDCLAVQPFHAIHLGSSATL